MEWGTRALGFLIDYVLALLLGGIFCLIGLLNSSSGTLVSAYVLMILGGLFGLWNLCYKQARGNRSERGSRTKLVSEDTGQPIGFGRALLRQLCHVIDMLPCCVGFSGLAVGWQEADLG